ncbi:hypothetical protein PRIPAC_92022 [Pristionchus pacificus]|uniref:Uncharacterized protein n=1 Tax=Pristionchus pacificus TaxID=54126 RepID=A0A2A6CIN6_PRIPA|nr:hypothetical protein PRIPAC_92022 [Pristionchus pacificus]|eukprot:PDM77937.1 hypothetical protein PRIPAC_34804 [Pristionchus pacificus]
MDPRNVGPSCRLEWRAQGRLAHAVLLAPSFLARRQTRKRGKSSFDNSSAENQSCRLVGGSALSALLLGDSDGTLTEAVPGMLTATNDEDDGRCAEQLMRFMDCAMQGL